MPLFAADVVPDIPDRFWKIPYDIAHDRDSATLMGIETGANCQNFAYELVRHFGRQVPYLRSSNLWDKTEHTIVVSEISRLIFCSSIRPPMPGVRMSLSTSATIERSI
jgi:hypothetical protein